MIRFNDYLDRLSIIKVLSFFLFVILVLTLIPMISDIYLGSLFFKFVLYAVMLLFFVYNFKKMDLSEGNGNSFLDALRNEYKSIFDVSNAISIIQFDSSLFGDFSSLGIDVMILYLLAIVVLTPIIEEILFRGIFLRRFNDGFNNLTVAILLSSLLFGICHSFGGILGAILFGICVSILYIKSRNILVAIFAHFLNNLISFVLALSGIENFIEGNFIAIVLIFILAIVSNFILFRAIINEWPNELI